MSRFAISKEGADSLKKLAKDIKNSFDGIKNITYYLPEKCSSHFEKIGIFSQEIKDIIEKNKSDIELIEDDVEIICKKLDELAGNIFIMLNSNLDEYWQSSYYHSRYGKSDFNNSVKNELYPHVDRMGITGAVKSFDFGNLSPDIVKDICVCINETKMLFPDLSLPFVGSSDEQQNRMKNIFFKSNYEELVKKSYGNMDKRKMLYEATEASDKKIKEVYNPLDNFAGLHLHVCDSYSEDLKKINGISFNNNFFKNKVYYIDILNNSEKTGFHPKSCNSVSSVVHHELGHEIDRIVGAEYDPEIRRLYNEFIQMSDYEKQNSLSMYASKNIKEFIAESWSEYMSTTCICRPMAKEVSLRMISLYRNKK